MKVKKILFTFYFSVLFFAVTHKCLAEEFKFKTEVPENVQKDFEWLNKRGKYTLMTIHVVDGTHNHLEHISSSVRKKYFNIGLNLGLEMLEEMSELSPEDFKKVVPPNIGPQISKSLLTACERISFGLVGSYIPGEGWGKTWPYTGYRARRFLFNAWKFIKALKNGPVYKKLDKNSKNFVDKMLPAIEKIKDKAGIKLADFMKQRLVGFFGVDHLPNYATNLYDDYIQFMTGSFTLYFEGHGTPVSSEEMINKKLNAYSVSVQFGEKDTPQSRGLKSYLEDQMKNFWTIRRFRTIHWFRESLMAEAAWTLQRLIKIMDTSVTGVGAMQDRFRQIMKGEVSSKYERAMMAVKSYMAFGSFLSKYIEKIFYSTDNLLYCLVGDLFSDAKKSWLFEDIIKAQKSNWFMHEHLRETPKRAYENANLHKGGNPLKFMYFIDTMLQNKRRYTSHRKECWQQGMALLRSAVPTMKKHAKYLSTNKAFKEFFAETIETGIKERLRWSFIGTLTRDWKDKHLYEDAHLTLKKIEPLVSALKMKDSFKKFVKKHLKESSKRAKNAKKTKNTLTELPSKERVQKVLEKSLGDDEEEAIDKINALETTIKK